MRAVTILKQGTPVASNVRMVDDWPEPIPGAGEVVIETEAAALNQLDLWVGRGVPGLDLTYPRVSGSDGCGRVRQIGEGVDRSWIERRVIFNAAVPRLDSALPGQAPAGADRIMIGEHTHGALAARFVAPVSNVLDVGDADPIEGAAFGLTHLTAWRMLVTRARIRAGQTVLITGIGGGVALAALGICKVFGCRTIVTSRHPKKLEHARALGATDSVLDHGQDWSREVRGLTAKRGVDVVVDSIGKTVHLASVKSLARGGSFVTCGCTTGPDALTDLARVFWNELSIIGSTMGDMDEFRQVTSLFRIGALKPVVHQVFPAAKADLAFASLEAGEQFGKVVVSFA